MKIEYSLLFVVIFFVDCSPVLENQRAVPLIIKDEQGNFKSNLAEVEKILLDSEIKDLKVAVVSIVGKYRRGKSFMLNFFLRYLNSKAVGNMSDWIGSDNDELKGFEWKAQAGRVTTGILIWSKIFITEINNEKIATILLDTQGIFDDDHVMMDHTKIFAMVTLLSSLEIYNVMRDIEEDDLQALASFTQYAEKFLNNSAVKMGQNLQFLIRDWSLPFEYPYGYEGGEQNLQKKLKTNKRRPEFSRVREPLKSSFERISCYLMPHPGLEILRNRHSKGKISALDDLFVEHLKEYVPSIFSKENLKVKKINGKPITVAELVHYIKYYEKIFTQEDDLTVKNIFENHVHATFDLAAKRTLQAYKSEILTYSDTFWYDYNEKELDYMIHQIVKRKAMKIFEDSFIKGSEDIYEMYKVKLEEEIELHYEKIMKALDEDIGRQFGVFIDKVHRIVGTVDLLRP